MSLPKNRNAKNRNDLSRLVISTRHAEQGTEKLKAHPDIGQKGGAAEGNFYTLAFPACESLSAMTLQCAAVVFSLPPAGMMR